MPLPTIDCKECGHVNEGERVYCHNCGAKLDRSILVGLNQQKESIQDKQRRIKKMMNPDSGLGRNWWKIGLKTLLGAAVTAAIVDMMLPPEGVPPLPKKGEPMEILQLDIALENLVAAPAGTRIAMKQDEVNAYLKNKARLKYDGNVFQSATTFQRAFVNLARSGCRITMQNALFDYPLYISQSVALKIDTIRDEKGETHRGLVAMPIHASIGRLMLPGIVAKYEGFIFDPLWEAFRREHKMLDELREIEVGNGEVILTSLGPKPTGSGPMSTQANLQPLIPPSAPANAPSLSRGGLGVPGGLQTGGLQSSGLGRNPRK